MQALENNIVRLEPIDLSHVDGILSAAQDNRIWEHMSVELIHRQDVVKYITEAIKKREAKTDFPFVIIHKPTNEIVGASWYMDISEQHKRLEIGSTWLHPKAWRTVINTNCKLLLLEYGFESLGMQRIQIKTGHENIQSQRAIERIGAVKEGVLRNHMIRKEGTVRHTVMYSITHEEWPLVKERIRTLLLS